MNQTTANTNRCCKCGATYLGYGGAVVEWSYINGVGPFCKMCIAVGVRVTFADGCDPCVETIK